jgi:hypothetical protein
MATRTFSPRLETRGAHADPKRFRQQITTRTARALGDRLINRDRVEFYDRQLFADAKRKPDDVYEMTREEHRITHLPDDELRAFIEKHIADGTITPRSLALFLGALGRDYLGIFPATTQADQQLWCALFKEGGEMFDAQVQARANPSRDMIGRAVAETDECVSVAQLLTASQRVAL